MTMYDRVRIICSKYDNAINFTDLNSKKVIYHRRSRKRNKNIDLKLVATNGKVLFSGEKKYSLDNYYETLDKNVINTLIVLTEKEKTLILSWVVRHKLNIVVLETSFPIFSAIKYYDNIEKNYYRLKKCIKYLKTLGVTSKSLSANFSKGLVNTIKRKVRYKTNFDRYFHLAYLPPYQEVFKFSEERDDRCIISLDYNSMFPSCLEGEFLEPKSVYFDDINSSYIGQELNNGLYRVVLINPIDSFFRQYHPFKFTKLNKSYTFNLEDNHEIEILLFKNELEYYSKFFKEVFLKSGLFSKNDIGHPLYGTSKRLYRKRLIAKKNAKKELQKFYKLRLAMLHSATNPLRYVKKSFKNLGEAEEYVSQKYWINSSDEKGISLLGLQHPKYFNFYFGENNIDFKGVNIDSADCLFSFSAQILATARLKISKLIERLSSFPQLDICYINTDSIHVSLPKSEKARFLGLYSDVINDEMGHLKVQAVGDKAFWFDVGRYYIVKDQKIIQYKNFILNHKGNNDPFLNSRRVVRKYKSNSFEHVIEYRKTLSSTLTYNKRLMLENAELTKTIPFNRFRYENIKTSKESYQTVTSEMISSFAYKEETYRQLKRSYITL